MCVTIHPFRDENEGPGHPIFEIWDAYSHTVAWELFTQHPFNSETKINKK